MQSIYTIIIGGITFLLITVFILLFYRMSKGQIKISGIIFVLMGMAIGCLGGFLVSFNLDTIKGWNPYGWWFIASFMSTILCGFIGIVIYGLLANKNHEKNIPAE